MDLTSKILLIVSSLFLVTIIILIVVVNNKTILIDKLQISLALSNDAILRQNSQIEALKLNKDALISELNKSENDIISLRKKISNMPTSTCQDKLSILDVLFKEVAK